MSALSASVEAANQGRQRARNPAAASGTAPAKGGAAKGGSGEGGPVGTVVGDTASDPKAKARG
jgi:hypothetical protein